MWHKDRRLGVLRGCPTWKPPLAEIRGCWIYSQPFLGATNPFQNPHWLSSLRVFAWISFWSSSSKPTALIRPPGGISAPGGISPPGGISHSCHHPPANPNLLWSPGAAQGRVPSPSISAGESCSTGDGSGGKGPGTEQTGVGMVPALRLGSARGALHLFGRPGPGGCCLRQLSGQRPAGSQQIGRVNV